MGSDRIGPGFVLDLRRELARDADAADPKHPFTRHSRGPLAESQAEALSSAIGRRGCIHVQSWRIFDDPFAARRQFSGTLATGTNPAASATGVPAGNLRWRSDRGSGDSRATRISESLSFTRPVFVRDGAHIAEQTVSDFSNAKPLDTVILNVYGSGAGRFELYEDDGNSLAYLTGRYALDGDHL